MSSNNYALEVHNISKCFEIYDKPSHRLKQFIMPRVNNLLRRPHTSYYQEFWALKNISFNLEKGQTIGIVGKNGSGKSTLLQIITSTLSPTLGSVNVHGKVAALLELGAGFNPEFTGIENIYLNASLLGLTKEETDNKLDSILSFADIGQFIHTSVKSYSSGMLVRLAFAVQAQVDPEILIVDEALAVGDAKFQAKCFARLKALKENGSSILFVSHATEQIVTHCDHAILLNNGVLQEQGKPKEIINHYLDILFGKPKINDPGRQLINLEIEKAVQGEHERLNRELAQDDSSHYNLVDNGFETHTQYNPTEYRWGDGAAHIEDFYISQNNQHYPNTFSSKDEILFVFKIKFFHTIIRPIFGFAIKTKDGVTLYNTNTEQQHTDFIDEIHAQSDIIISVKLPLLLAQGDYFVSVGIASSNTNGEITPHDRRYDSIHLAVEPTAHFSGLIDLNASIHVEK